MTWNQPSAKGEQWSRRTISGLRAGELRPHTKRVWLLVVGALTAAKGPPGKLIVGNLGGHFNLLLMSSYYVKYLKKGLR